MKVVGWLAGIGTLVAAAAYMIVSLNRWEWNRALFFGLIFLIAEVGLATGLILRRLARLEARPIDPEVLAAIRESRGERADRFAWIKESTTSRLSVFITFLVGGGVLVSVLAWVVDRIAGRTSTPIAEQQLARQLAAIGYPPGGLVVDDITALAQDVPGADDAQLRKLLRRAGRA
ncbi:MAG TPA: hypothetical protein VF228_06700 [Iamia sp.]